MVPRGRAGESGGAELRPARCYRDTGNRTGMSCISIRIRKGCIADWLGNPRLGCSLSSFNARFVFGRIAAKNWICTCFRVMALWAPRWKSGGGCHRWRAWCSLSLSTDSRAGPGIRDRKPWLDFGAAWGCNRIPI